MKLIDTNETSVVRLEKTMKLVDLNKCRTFRKTMKFIDTNETNVVRLEKTIKLVDSNGTNVVRSEKR